ncbi:hypothetical protein OUZ56_027735 [Daphnia magna]|uniref:Uncharacterized protein n=1 Tax=Daphnia magna TaxID=35525 RepID=A0ABR0B1S2_9CRUS|nr:hypothetical protein OUZ56_027735 [Daphnia magna]
MAALVEGTTASSEAGIFHATFHQLLRSENKSIKESLLSFEMITFAQTILWCRNAQSSGHIIIDEEVIPA